MEVDFLKATYSQLQNGDQGEIWFGSHHFKNTFQKCFWPMWLGLNYHSKYNCLWCVDCVYTAQSQSPSLVPADETLVPTNRRFPSLTHGINRKVSWGCGLGAIALPLISSDPLLRTESLQHHTQPAVSAQEKALLWCEVLWAANYI